MDYTGHYARAGERIGDILEDRGKRLVVEICGKSPMKREIWKTDLVEIIQFGSMNPKNSNYEIGGKVIKGKG